MTEPSSPGVPRDTSCGGREIGLRCPLERADRHKIGVVDRLNISNAQGNHGTGLAGCCDKLYLQAVGRMGLHNGSQISSPKRVLGEIASEVAGEERCRGDPANRLGGFDATDHHSCRPGFWTKLRWRSLWRFGSRLTSSFAKAGFTGRSGRGIGRWFNPRIQVLSKRGRALVLGFRFASASRGLQCRSVRTRGCSQFAEARAVVGGSLGDRRLGSKRSGPFRMREPTDRVRAFLTPPPDALRLDPGGSRSSSGREERIIPSDLVALADGRNSSESRRPPSPVDRPARLVQGVLARLRPVAGAGPLPTTRFVR